MISSNHKLLFPLCCFVRKHHSNHKKRQQQKIIIIQTTFLVLVVVVVLISSNKHILAVVDAYGGKGWVYSTRNPSSNLMPTKPKTLSSSYICHRRNLLIVRGGADSNKDNHQKTTNNNNLRLWSTTTNNDNSLPTEGILNNNDDETNTSSEPIIILVVGATGKVGRIIVQKLLLLSSSHDGANNHPITIRCLVRNINKAKELFGNNTNNNIEYYEADLCESNKYETIIENAVNGCNTIISVMGAVRLSHLSDFLPWRIFCLNNIEQWAEQQHPYYGNYIGQKKLLNLAMKYNIQRFVRLTGLSSAYPAFHPITILFNTMLSCTVRWQSMFEQELIQQQKHLPYIIIRPGGLSSNPRNTTTTNVQIEASGKLPLPGRIGREDVADLCIASIPSSGVVPADQSYTIACRWVGQDIQPRPQGKKSDGYPSVQICFQQLVMKKSNENTSVIEGVKKMKPYGLAVGFTVYTLAAFGIKLMLSLLSLIIRRIGRPI